MLIQPLRFKTIRRVLTCLALCCFLALNCLNRGIEDLLFELDLVKVIIIDLIAATSVHAKYSE